MKVLRDGECYLLKGVVNVNILPENIKSQLIDYNIDFYKVEGEEAVNYFANDKNILDYESIKDLSTEDLHASIKHLSEKADLLHTWWNVGNFADRTQLLQDTGKLDEARQDLIKAYGLILYYSYREYYDSFISEMLFHK